MKLDEMKQRLLSVESTLDTIELKGISNMGKMIGCVQIIQEILSNLKDEEASE